jgi:FkbM family methyltransferase
MSDSFRLQLRRAANRLLAPFDLRLGRASRASEMGDIFIRARRRGVRLATVVDVGASDGSWSLRMRRQYPEARYLLFEPLTERHAALERLRHTYGFDFVPAAAGASTGTVRFHVDPQLDGSGIATPDAANTREVPIETVDAALVARGLAGPYCLKLDTHGFEIPVLEGARRTLEQTELLIVEVYNFTLTPGCLRFHELCSWLEAHGLRCCDLADPLRRPRDGVLWQMDLAFAPATSPIFSSNRYD